MAVQQHAPQLDYFPTFIHMHSRSIARSGGTYAPSPSGLAFAVTILFVTFCSSITVSMHWNNDVSEYAIELYLWIAMEVFIILLLLPLQARVPTPDPQLPCDRAVREHSSA